MDINVNHLVIAADPVDVLFLNHGNLDRTEVWGPDGTLTWVIRQPTPFETAPPEHGEVDRGPGLMPFLGSSWDVLNPGLAIHAGGEYRAVQVPQGKARFWILVFGELEIPEFRAIDIFDSQGLWRALQPVDFPSNFAALDWHTNRLNLVNRQEDAGVYRFAFHPLGASKAPGANDG